MKRIGLVGLGRMGLGLTQRWLSKGFTVVGYDLFVTATIQHDSFSQVKELEQLVSNSDVIWLMIPAGDPVKTIVNELVLLCKAGAVVIDGGNSFFKDSVAAAQILQEKNINFLDCGVSGGLYGIEHGFSLMIGGQQKVFFEYEDIFKAVAAPYGYCYIGPSGSGHYVKMVHNGIEYALLQAYAEGFNLLKHGQYKDLDLAAISKVWQHGAIIDSFILKLVHEVLSEDQTFANISGKVAESGTGRWTVEEAREQSIPVKLIEDALTIRIESQISGGNYATKLVALLRNKFGGHAVEQLEN